MTTTNRGQIKDIRTIKNMQQANFYIQNKVELLRLEYDDYCKKIVFIFKDSEHLQEVFVEWVARKYKR